ncbi:uncharacterized protein DUF1127 [Plasticicumulans lactativorans]|uniref:Uncharacterized protein DUF1127 n=1 Tax=Plasticicumulans lactativorans TaxID=1133106 RepID=A0A4R2L613_9GAMM|nr:DUF1127 domain-containing protein [Plasticicumulans lactativorans]TCO81295.1 uncharacterized protein DUF1127 [Plasticicumulans lactativorans]
MFLLIQLFSLAHNRFENRAAKRQLAALSDRNLADIGIERAEITAVVEAADAAASGRRLRYARDIASPAQQFAYMRAHLGGTGSQLA